ncbi:MAG TPA: adenylate/guanylate cyclase domain-containing protein, partial [Terrimesophilobacter sp.]|nr:adenylate/guanylate cyclase domain-containing protein [Terrimesophilobacter sp.]
ARRALRVAREVQRAMANHRGDEPDFELACGVALHVGDVLFGNVGASDRLDFTVIGPAVNLVTRIESLSKRATSGIVASEDFVRREGGDYETLGRHELKGISQPREVFSARP